MSVSNSIYYSDFALNVKLIIVKTVQASSFKLQVTGFPPKADPPPAGILKPVTCNLKLVTCNL